jgi:hypothetical protein
LNCNFAVKLNFRARRVNASLHLLNSGHGTARMIFAAVARVELTAMVDFPKKQPPANHGLASR